MKMDLYLTVAPIVFGMMGIFLLAVGLWGIAAKRPFLISARWLFLMVVVVFSPSFLMSLSFSSPRGFMFMGWLPLLMFGCLFLLMWHQMRGYMAYAVTDTSFREALLAALGKLQLPYQESLSSIRLTSVEADLQVAVQSWMGTGQIKVKQGRHRLLLREIVHAMNKYFRTSSVRTNMISCAFFVFIGAIMVISAISLSSFRNIF